MEENLTDTMQVDLSRLLPPSDVIDSAKRIVNLLNDANPNLNWPLASGVKAILMTVGMGIPAVMADDYFYLERKKVTPNAKAHKHVLSMAGYEWTTEQTESECHVTFYRDGREVDSVSYTIAEAEAAGLLGKSVWKQYPKDMLLARCLSRATRTLPLVMFIGYTAEEISDTEDFGSEATYIDNPPSKQQSGQGKSDPAPTEDVLSTIKLMATAMWDDAAPEIIQPIYKTYNAKATSITELSEGQLGGLMRMLVGYLESKDEPQTRPLPESFTAEIAYDAEGVPFILFDRRGFRWYGNAEECVGLLAACGYQFAYNPDGMPIITSDEDKNNDGLEEGAVIKLLKSFDVHYRWTGDLSVEFWDAQHS